MTMDVETYHYARRLADQLGARILEATAAGRVLLDREGWFAPQWHRIGDGCLIKERS